MFLESYFSQEESPVSEMSMASQVQPSDLYRDYAQSVFDQRCVQCHSCNNAPCQLNLTSYEGVRRGFHKTPAIDPERLQSTPPTRLGIDGRSESDWRRLGFHSVLKGSNLYATLLLKSLTLKEKSTKKNPNGMDPLAATESMECPKAEDYLEFGQARSLAGMPYNLPALSASELKKVTTWMAAGAPGPKKPLFIASQEEQSLKKSWEEFFNAADLRQRLVARYLYEHLFLAHIYFKNEQSGFYRMIRSRTACADPSEISTRRPIDDPGKIFFYCFKSLQQTIAEKTHIPYRLDAEKKVWIENNFLSEAWKVSKLPSYVPALSANPFKTFRDIPIAARYRFLLEDSHYHINTFIKGPVCNGSKAVSAIDEQFYVFFTDPKADLMIKDSQFSKSIENLLVLPAEIGTNSSILEMGYYLRHYPQARNKYRLLRHKTLKRHYPKGLGLETLWDGSSAANSKTKNPNAVLTVMRHSDNSYVLQGAKGPPSHSAFVLDYALFERLVYNLTVGFDLYGNISHQFHTRVYMGMIRTEGEGNFLEYLPPAGRNRLRNHWYSAQGLRAFERAVVQAPLPENFPASLKFSAKNPEALRNEFYAQIFKERLNHHESLALPSPEEASALSALAGLEVRKGAGWVEDLPDSVFVMEEDGDKITNLWTLIRNKRYKDIGSMFLADSLREPERDSLLLVKDLGTSYPHYFFFVPRQEISEFVKSLKSGKLSEAKKNWGRERSDQRFWKDSDRLHRFIFSSYGEKAGVLDYTKYDDWD